MSPGGWFLAVDGANAGVAVDLNVVAELRAETARRAVVVILAAAGLVANTGIESEGFAVGGVSAPDAVAETAATAAWRRLGNGETGKTQSGESNLDKFLFHDSSFLGVIGSLS